MLLLFTTHTVYVWFTNLPLRSRYWCQDYLMISHESRQNGTYWIDFKNPVSVLNCLEWINMSRFGHHCARGWTVICVGLCCPGRVSRAGIGGCILQFTVGCDYLSLPGMSAPGGGVLICYQGIGERSTSTARLKYKNKNKTSKQNKVPRVRCSWTVVEGVTGHLSQPLTN